eukprot:Rmarinus@m.26701
MSDYTGSAGDRVRIADGQHEGKCGFILERIEEGKVSVQLERGGQVEIEDGKYTRAKASDETPDASMTEDSNHNLQTNVETEKDTPAAESTEDAGDSAPKAETESGQPESKNEDDEDKITEAIFIGRIPFSWSGEQLVERFSKFGKIVKLVVPSAKRVKLPGIDDVETPENAPDGGEKEGGGNQQPSEGGDIVMTNDGDENSGDGDGATKEKTENVEAQDAQSGNGPMADEEKPAESVKAPEGEKTAHSDANDEPSSEAKEVCLAVTEEIVEAAVNDDKTDTHSQATSSAKKTKKAKTPRAHIFFSIITYEDMASGDAAIAEMDGYQSEGMQIPLKVSRARRSRKQRAGDGSLLQGLATRARRGAAQCRFWLRDKSCRYGNRCQFVHQNPSEDTPTKKGKDTPAHKAKDSPAGKKPAVEKHEERETEPKFAAAEIIPLLESLGMRRVGDLVRDCTASLKPSGPGGPVVKTPLQIVHEYCSRQEGKSMEMTMVPQGEGASRRFEAQVKVGGEVLGTHCCASKQKARQLAAGRALEKLLMRGVPFSTFTESRNGRPSHRPQHPSSHSGSPMKQGGAGDDSRGGDGAGTMRPGGRGRGGGRKRMYEQEGSMLGEPPSTRQRVGRDRRWEGPAGRGAGGHWQGGDVGPAPPGYGSYYGAQYGGGRKRANYVQGAGPAPAGGGAGQAHGGRYDSYQQAYQPRTMTAEPYERTPYQAAAAPTGRQQFNPRYARGDDATQRTRYATDYSASYQQPQAQSTDAYAVYGSVPGHGQASRSFQQPATGYDYESATLAERAQLINQYASIAAGATAEGTLAYTTSPRDVAAGYARGTTQSGAAYTAGSRDQSAYQEAAVAGYSSYRGNLIDTTVQAAQSDAYTQQPRGATASYSQSRPQRFAAQNSYQQADTYSGYAGSYSPAARQYQY